MSFDRLAPHYRWMEAVLAGDLLQRCRTRWLSEVRGSRRALLVGEGHGRMLEACARELPHCELTVLDRSEGMLQQAERRWRRLVRPPSATFQAVDLRTWTGAGGDFDLVVTNFFLDCFAPDELARVISGISASASPSAHWLVSDFTVPETGWQRVRARAALALAYGFFRIATGISARGVTAPDDALCAAGFRLRGREMFNHGLLHSDLWSRGRPTMPA